MKSAYLGLILAGCLFFSHTSHAQSVNKGSPVFEKTRADLQKAYCEISNSIHYMYNYMSREDGGFFKYKAHEFSENAKEAIEKADKDGLYFFYDNDPTFQIAKEKIIAAHNEIKDLTLYDPSRDGIKNRLVNPAKAAIRKLNHDMELEMDLDTCDAQYPN